MIIILNTVDNKQITIKDAVEFNFTQSTDAACDSFWATFFVSTAIDEIVEVRVMQNDRIIFFGYCDCQRITRDENGYKVFFYARSCAGILVDNEAEPTTYEKPSATQLVFSVAQPYGFVSKLPEIYSDSLYEVQKGASCFSAINKFVKLLTGKQIYVTPKKEIICLEKSEDVRELAKYKLLKTSFVINRSEPCSKINFKKQSSNVKYLIHTKSKTCDELRIDRQKYINLSAIPQWQRENTVIDTIKSSFERYKVLEAVVGGYVEEPLNQRYRYSDDICDYGELVLSEKQYICDKYGARTKLVLRKDIDIKEITYVD